MVAAQGEGDAVGGQVDHVHDPGARGLRSPGALPGQSALRVRAAGDKVCRPGQVLDHHVEARVGLRGPGHPGALVGTVHAAGQSQDAAHGGVGVAVAEFIHSSAAASTTSPQDRAFAVAVCDGESNRTSRAATSDLGRQVPDGTRVDRYGSGGPARAHAPASSRGVANRLRTVSAPRGSSAGGWRVAIRAAAAIRSTIEASVASGGRTTASARASRSAGSSASASHATVAAPNAHDRCATSRCADGAARVGGGRRPARRPGSTPRSPHRPACRASVTPSELGGVASDPHPPRSADAPVGVSCGQPDPLGSRLGDSAFTGRRPVRQRPVFSHGPPSAGCVVSRRRTR